MKILALDIAVNTGFALFDTARHESAIRCGSMALSKRIPSGTPATERRHIATAALDESLCRLIDGFKPDYAVVELPLGRIQTHQPKRKGMFVDQEQEEAKGGGANSDTVLMLNQLFATATTVLRHKIKPLGFETVAPRSWQSAIHKGLPGASTKEKSIAFAKAIGVTFPGDLNKKDREDAADAICIAVWCHRNSKYLKMLEVAA